MAHNKKAPSGGNREGAGGRAIGADRLFQFQYSTFPARFHLVSFKAKAGLA